MAVGGCLEYCVEDSKVQRHEPLLMSGGNKAMRVFMAQGEPAHRLAPGCHVHRAHQYMVALTLGSQRSALSTETFLSFFFFFF